MNVVTKKFLNRARKMLGNGTFRDSDGELLPIGYSGEAAANLLYEMLSDSAPCMISRLGRMELQTIRRLWFGMGRATLVNAAGYVTGRHGAFWWEPQHLDGVRDHCGFFPNDRASVEAFSLRYFADLPMIDVLGSWCEGEKDLLPLLNHAKVIGISDLEPFFQAQPWTRALEGKKVLVIHPFAASIERQFSRRKDLFNRPGILPNFDLRTITAVQSMGGLNSNFETWFDALKSMTDEMERTDFDVALIGAGAYGLPLAAHAKRMGKQAVHVGGALQLFFGIRGKRWDDREEYRALWNEHWIRPDSKETPPSKVQVEDGCYW
jgi:hypothetical protein